MTDIDSQLKPYTCHKKVRAAEITCIGNYITSVHGALVRSVTLNKDLTVDLPDQMFVRYVPSPGDFLVVYDDGYRSFSPRQQFLDGYTLNGEGNSVQKRIDAAIAQNPADPYPTGELQTLLRDCSGEIERLKGILRRCVRGPDMADLGNGEILALHLPHGGGKN